MRTMLSFALAAAVGSIGTCASVSPAIGNAATDAGLRDHPIIASSDPVYLDGFSWTATSDTHQITMEAGVPGDLITDLQRNEIIDDPYYELNWLNSSLWNDGTWRYTTSFSLRADHVAAIKAGNGADTLLVFDGIKMGARIFVNGVEIGNSTDQFLRQEFSLAQVAKVGDLRADGNNVTVLLDNSVFTDGRFMACSGGWDWAPYANQNIPAQPGTTNWFTRGIWKSVYTVDVAESSAALTHLVPHVFYQGDYPTAPLEEHKHGGFQVKVRVHLWAPAATKGTVTVKGSWGAGQVATQDVDLPAGHSNVTVTLQAEAQDILLWWPANLGAQPRYGVSASFAASSPVPVSGAALQAPDDAPSASRLIGFRYAVIVTGNDTDPEYVKNSKDADGSSGNGMFFRVNGAAVYARGANMIPIEELEGRRNSSALRQMVVSARDGGFNILRVWGGGIFQDQAWYDECDEQGLLVYHDLQYAQQGHSPDKTATQAAEYRHQIRRLGYHPSIILIDGCNECAVIIGTSTGIYATFSLTIVAEEDQSRAVWPSCPSAGWAHGVNRLTGAPNGSPKGLVPASYDSPPSDDHRLQHNTKLEVHGPYQHSGSDHYEFVNGPDNIDLPPTFIPPQFTEQGEYGVGYTNQFASEFGCVTLQSFESMSPTLAKEHWGIHGGAPSDKCSGGFAKKCTGDNVMAQRNYPMDGLIQAFFGKQDFNATGEQVFKQQCFQSMIAQALNIKGEVEQQRSKNMFGTITWQYGEIWPTGGWGSVEYSSPVPGQVMGGRWKPLQYWYRSSIYADVMATCGGDGTCYARNDFPFDFAGHLTVRGISLVDGSSRTFHDADLKLPAGPGSVEFFQANVSEANATETVFVATVTQSQEQRQAARASPRLVQSASEGGSSVVSSNVLLNQTPGKLAVRPSGLKAAVASTANADGSVDITLTGDHVAVYATMTTAAHGRFSDNAFVFQPPSATVQFLPYDGTVLDMDLLKSTLRVEDLSSYQ